LSPGYLARRVLRAPAAPNFKGSKVKNPFFLVRRFFPPIFFLGGGRPHQLFAVCLF
jgi:hypothetical protein